MAIRALLTLVILLTLTFQAAKAQNAPTTSDSLTTLTGKWAGTFEGETSGKLELLLNQESNRKLTGQITVIVNDGDRYTTELKTVVWQSGKLMATYSDPSGGDVSFSGNYTKQAFKGTWSSDGGQATGTWQASR